MRMAPSEGNGVGGGGASSAPATLSLESIRAMGESSGIASLPDEAARELADDVSFKLKMLIQDAAKFMHHSKRFKFMPDDVNHALKLRNIEVVNYVHKYCLIFEINYFNLIYSIFLATIWIFST